MVGPPGLLWASVLVAVGGAVGSLARFHAGRWFGLWAKQAGAPTHWPFGTLLVNLTGCLLIGLLAGLAERASVVTDELRLLLVTGLLGGYTTFSAFGLETLLLIRSGEWLLAAVYVLASVIGGLLLVWIGYAMLAAKS